jgi:Domain of unknown function (DUF5615)
MRIKLDHNLSPRLAPQLKDLGHEVSTAYDEHLEKAADNVLLFEAALEDRVLFTLDKGFGDTGSYPPHTHSGIVVFEQRKGESISQVEKRLLAFARSTGEKKCRGKVLVVEKTRVKALRRRRRVKNSP